MSKRNGIGCKGGTSATAGKKSFRYVVTLPGGREVMKRVFTDLGDSPIATGFMHDGRPIVAVWPDQPAWEGEFGRMVARRA